jgi:hypothetical protein
MTTLERLDLGRSLGKVLLKCRTEGSPRETFSIQDSTTKGGMSLLVLIPPKDFVNARGTTPSLVAPVAKISGRLQGWGPVFLPMGRTRRAITNGSVKGPVDGLIQRRVEVVDIGTRGRRVLNQLLHLREQRSRERAESVLIQLAWICLTEARQIP